MIRNIMNKTQFGSKLNHNKKPKLSNRMQKFRILGWVNGSLCSVLWRNLFSQKIGYPKNVVNKGIKVCNKVPNYIKLDTFPEKGADILSFTPHTLGNREIQVMLNVVHTEIISEYKNCDYLPMKERRVDELSRISLHLVTVNVTMNVEQDCVQSGTNGDTKTDLSKRLTENHY